MEAQTNAASRVHCPPIRRGGPGDAGPSRALLWDGRLDNRHELVAASRQRRDALDSDVVCAAYDREGLAALGRVIGDWSIVIADERRGAIVLASDYAGVRPLYYRTDATGVRWSTRLDSLAPSTGGDDVDEAYVRAYLDRGGGAHRTPFAGIFAVPAGHAVTVSERGVSVDRFWTPPVATHRRYRDERDYDEHLRHLFTEAVTVRLRSTASAVAELSGGLDSSSVVCVADKLMRAGDVATRSLATVSYVHDRSSDVPFIEAVETARGQQGVRLSTHEYPLVTASESGGSMPAGWGPLHKSVVRVTRALDATMLLTGQNGDLVMGNWIDDSLQVAAAVRRGAARRALADSLAWSRATRMPMLRIMARGVLAALPPTLSPEGLFAVDASRPAQCLTPGFRRRTAAAVATTFDDDWRWALPERRRHFRALAFMREMRTLQRLEHAPQIDYTHPFAHRPLVEFAMSIPADVLCRPEEPRRLMRRAFAPLWPAALRRRRSKSLFGAPWVQALRPLAAGLLATDRWEVVERGWIDRAQASAKLQRLVFGIDADQAELRHLLLLEYWLRHRTATAHDARVPAV